jgi:multidrug transporter EmrE-like cation transporter
MSLLGRQCRRHKHFKWCRGKTVPLGTAYAVWLGIGTVGTAIYGMIAYRRTDLSYVYIRCLAVSPL